MADDALAKLTPAEVAAFYSRLADAVEKNKGTVKVSLASALLRLWLKNRDASASLTIDPPEHLKAHARVRDTLIYHRQVFLSERKARIAGREDWAGVLPRLKGKPPHRKWEYRFPTPIEYESLVEMPLRYQLTGSDADKDLLYALHGFQLHSAVLVVGQAPSQPQSTRITIQFQSFETHAMDWYHWDYSEHLTTPNPDFGSKDKAAVAPASQSIVVYHRNAKRVEDAGLAAPFHYRTTSWRVTDPAVMGPGQVDVTRSV